MLTIGIVCLDELACLRACLSSVLKHGCDSARVVVVDRGSCDGTAEYLDSIDSIEYVMRDGASHAEAVNWLFEEHGGHDVLLVGASVAIESSDWISRLRAAVVREEKVGLVTGQILYPDGRIANQGRHIVSGMGFAPQHANLGYLTLPREGEDRVVEVDSVSSDLVYCTAEVVESICGMDPSFSAEFGAYDDLAMQVRLAGYKVLVDPGVRALRYRPVLPATNTLPFAEPEGLHLFAAASLEEFTFVHAEDWETKWGWNPKYPDLGEIRRLYDNTEICWQIGDAMRLDLRDRWPSVDVVITSRNNLPSLRRTMESLLQTDYPHLSVYVVDNASDDGSLDYLEELVEDASIPVELLVMPVNTGAVVGSRLGMVEGDGDFVAWIEEGMTMSPCWLQELVSVFRERPFAGVVGPVILEPGPQVAQRWGSWSKLSHGEPSVQCRAQGTDLGQLHRVVHLRPGCKLYRRDVLSLCGFLDSRFVESSSPEVDLHAAMAHQGFEAMLDGRVSVVDFRDATCESSSRGKRTEIVAAQAGEWDQDAWGILEGSIARSREGSIVAAGVETPQFYFAANYAQGLPAQVYNRLAADQVDAMLLASHTFLTVDGPCASYWAEIFSHAQRLFEDRSYEAALNVLACTINLYPWSARAYQASAHCLVQLGRPREAEVLRLRCAALDGGEVDDSFQRIVADAAADEAGSESAVSLSAANDPFRVLLINSNTPGAFDQHEFIQLTAEALRFADVEVAIAVSPPVDVHAYDLVHLFHSGDSLRLRQMVRYLRVSGVVAPVVMSPTYESPRRVKWLEQSVAPLFRAAQDEVALADALRSLAVGTLEVEGANGRSMDGPVFDDADTFLRQAIEDTNGLVVYSRLEQESLLSTLQVSCPAWTVASPLDAELMKAADPRVFVDRFGIADFALSVGEICPAENQLMTVHAMRGKGVPLVIVGRGHGDAYEREVRRRADADVVFVDTLEPLMLASAMSAAKVFVTPGWLGCDPSLAIAAAHANCEVVTGELTAAAEILAEIAYSCDPADVTSIQRTVLEALGNRPLRSTRRERWRRSRRENSAPLKVARELLVCYQRAINLSHAAT